MDPNLVIGPKNKIQRGSIKILFGNAFDSVFSIATMIWDKKARVGMRWNGFGCAAKGYPRGKWGHPQ